MSLHHRRGVFQFTQGFRNSNDFSLFRPLQLKNQAMAEAYCGRIWKRHESATNKKSTVVPAASKPGATEVTPSPEEEVYLCLLRVYLSDGGKDEASVNDSSTPPDKAGSSATVASTASAGNVGGLDDAISLLERHFARVDPVQVMALLPPDVSVKKLMPFLGSAVKHVEAQKRSNQVCLPTFARFATDDRQLSSMTRGA